MDKRLERILPRVQKPARYAGGEYNEVKKDKRDGRRLVMMGPFQIMERCFACTKEEPPSTGAGGVSAAGGEAVASHSCGRPSR